MTNRSDVTRPVDSGQLQGAQKSNLGAWDQDIVKDPQASLERNGIRPIDKQTTTIGVSQAQHYPSTVTKQQRTAPLGQRSGGWNEHSRRHEQRQGRVSIGTLAKESHTAQPSKGFGASSNHLQTQSSNSYAYTEGIRPYSDFSHSKDIEGPSRYRYRQGPKTYNTEYKRVRRHRSGSDSRFQKQQNDESQDNHYDYNPQKQTDYTEKNMIKSSIAEEEQETLTTDQQDLDGSLMDEQPMERLPEIENVKESVSEGGSPKEKGFLDKSVTEKLKDEKAALERALGAQIMEKLRAYPQTGKSWILEPGEEVSSSEGLSQGEEELERQYELLWLEQRKEREQAARMK